MAQDRLQLIRQDLSLQLLMAQLQPERQQLTDQVFMVSLIITISNQIVPVTGITVTGAGGATIITSENGTLQLSAAILPANATNKSVTWSLINGTGQATINSSGLVTAISNGTVTARATANDGSGISWHSADNNIKSDDTCHKNHSHRSRWMQHPLPLITEHYN